MIDQTVILTAFTDNLYDDFIYFITSLRRFSHLKVCVVNLGISEDHLTSLKAFDNIDFISLNEEIRHKIKDLGPNWTKFLKPYYFTLIRKFYNNIIWIDVDTVICSNLENLCSILDIHPMIFNDYFAPISCLNHEDLYTIFHVPVLEEKKAIALNSGVVCLSLSRELDAKILEKWISNTDLATKYPAIQHLVSLYDQGILLWSLHELGAIDFVFDWKCYNYPARRNIYQYNDVEQTIDNIIEDNPGAIIAHFAGVPKVTDLKVYNSHHTINYLRHKHKTYNQIKILHITKDIEYGREFSKSLRRIFKLESSILHGGTLEQSIENLCREDTVCSYSNNYNVMSSLEKIHSCHLLISLCDSEDLRLPENICNLIVNNNLAVSIDNYLDDNSFSNLLEHYVDADGIKILRSAGAKYIQSRQIDTEYIRLMRKYPFIKR